MGSRHKILPLGLTKASALVSEGAGGGGGGSGAGAGAGAVTTTVVVATVVVVTGAEAFVGAVVDALVKGVDDGVLAIVGLTLSGAVDDAATGDDGVDAALTCGTAFPLVSLPHAATVRAPTTRAVMSPRRGVTETSIP